MKDMNSLRHNIAAVGETRQITGAMHLLSAARAKKSLKTVGYNKEYMEMITGALRHVFRCTDGKLLPICRKSDNAKKAFIIISSDKGLCGAYNSSVTSLLLSEIKKCEQKPYIACIGSAAYDILKSHGINPELQWLGASQHPSQHHARRITEHFIEMFSLGLIGDVTLVYTEYVSQMEWQPRLLHLLPVLREDFTSRDTFSAPDTFFEPSADAVLKTIIPEYLTAMIYETLCQSTASENVCRMNAMQSATKNADELIGKLNLQFNSARQLQITNEIAEISSATEIQKAGN